MRAIGVIPVHVIGNIGACRAHAVVHPEGHPLVLHAAPQALNVGLRSRTAD